MNHMVSVNFRYYVSAVFLYHKNLMVHFTNIKTNC
jgi:hypothetical protein